MFFAFFFGRTVNIQSRVGACVWNIVSFCPFYLSSVVFLSHEPTCPNQLFSLAGGEVTSPEGLGFHHVFTVVYARLHPRTEGRVGDATRTTFLVLNIHVDDNVLLSLSDAQPDATAWNFWMYVLFNGWILFTFQHLCSPYLGVLRVEFGNQSRQNTWGCWFW